MGLKKPYYRIYRENKKSDNKYLRSPEYSQDTTSLKRAFHMLQEDLKKIFEYIEPHTDNYNTYSHRLYELFLRICTEIESNFKGILQANGYVKSNSYNWNIKDYYKVEAVTKLSSYELKIKLSNKEEVLKPFKDWSERSRLSWYQDYNTVKHNRLNNFNKANLKNVLTALAGLHALLYSQFQSGMFNLYGGSSAIIIGKNGIASSLNSNIFILQSIGSWSEEEKYDFNWDEIKSSSTPIEAYQFK